MKKSLVCLLTVTTMFSASLFANSTVEQNAADFSERVTGTVGKAFSGFSKGFSKNKSLCLNMEDNYFLVMQNNLFAIETGEVIQQKWEEGNQEAAKVMSQWRDFLGKPQPKNFASTWEKFWRKELNHYLFVETYRCNTHGKKMPIALEKTSLFMQREGYANWEPNFYSIINQMEN